jgi:virulence-associated protein VagC
MTARIFKSGNSKAIRIPKGILDDVDIVELDIKGDKIIITPKKNSLDELFNLIEANKDLTKDFLINRNQPSVQKRELF